MLLAGGRVLLGLILSVTLGVLLIVLGKVGDLGVVWVGSIVLAGLRAAGVGALLCAVVAVAGSGGFVAAGAGIIGALLLRAGVILILVRGVGLGLVGFHVDSFVEV